MDELRQHYPDVPDAVIAAVDAGNRIQAIKLLREETGLGLREAKDIVDGLAAQRGGLTDDSPGIVEHGGAAALIRMVIAIVILVLLYRVFFAA